MTGVAPLHLGPMHGHEMVLLAILAFGPFVALVVAGVVIGRRDGAGEGGEHTPSPHTPSQHTPSPRGSVPEHPDAEG